MSRLLHIPHHHSRSNRSIKGWLFILPADTSRLVTTAMSATSREVSICWMRQGTLTTRKKTNKLNILTLTLPVHRHDAAFPMNMIPSGPFHKFACRKLLMSEALSQEIVPSDCFLHACVLQCASPAPPPSHTEKMQPKLGFVLAQRCSKGFSFYCED